MTAYSASWFCIHPQSHVSEVENRGGLNPRNCGTCECPIAGKTFNCSACSSDLHPFCKSCPPCLPSALHPDHPLTRLNRDMTLALTRCCDVCREEIRGVSYTCSPCNFDVHPQCSQLPRRIPHGPETHHALLLQVAEISNANCHVCGDRCGKWVYSCDVCSIHLHFWCLLNQPADESPYAGPATTTTRGLNRHFRRPQQYQGQHYAVPPPYYHNNGRYAYQHHGHHWGWNHFPQNNNNNHGGGGGHGGGGFIGGIMGRIAGSLAVGMLCDVVAHLIRDGFFLS